MTKGTEVTSGSFSREANRTAFLRPHLLPYSVVALDAFTSDLALLVRARHPIIFIKTNEKDRMQGLLMHLSDRLKMPFYVWTRTKGLKHVFEHVAVRVGRERGTGGVLAPLLADKPSNATLAPVTALGDVEMRHAPALYNFQGLATDLADPLVATKLRDAARQFLKHEGSIVITREVPDELPNVIAGLATVLEPPTPSEKDYRKLVTYLYRDLAKRTPLELHLTGEELTRLVRNLQGLTLLEAEKVLTKAMIEDNRLGPDDLQRVLDSKREIVEREGLLEYYPLEESLIDVAGLAGLKRWLGKRRALMLEPERAAAFGLSFPKGILLLGIQGCGKSLCAKAVASDWGLPLLRMDPATLYNKYIGETEKNFRRATKAAERMSPVVLWLDEIEKAFASNDTDGGVSQRVLGTFLSWLQERSGDVFVVATANDVSALPPELIRKGRFDEIFFVDLPDEAVRRAIFELHLKKRKRNPVDFDLEVLARTTAGFSGAELEQVVVSGLYGAFAAHTELSTELLLDEVQQTVPLSKTMGEKLAGLRAWAAERSVPAN